MIINKKCPKCGNEQFSKGEISTEHWVVFKPDGYKIRYGGNVTAQFRADVCLKCGYTDIYLDEKGLANVVDNEERIKNKKGSFFH
jgi:predicted nucleic-acid-binding Zn-ribbon protein